MVGREALTFRNGRETVRSRLAACTVVRDPKQSEEPSRRDIEALNVVLSQAYTELVANIAVFHRDHGSIKAPDV